MDPIDALQTLIHSIPTTPVNVLQHTCRNILSNLPQVQSNDVDFSLHILASDIIVRLECDSDPHIWTEEHLTVLNDRMEAIRAKLQGKIMADNTSTNIGGQTRKLAQSPLSHPTSTLEYDPQSERYIMLRDFLLDSLAFRAMSDREEQVTQAFSSTFNWIYDEHTFSSWLCGNTEGSLYWINGLPGSGKSTLMLYINQQNRTLELLQEWAGDAPISLASFFFWESGTAVQRSQAGLLRSLLYQLLTQQPELIPAVFPSLWEKIWAADAQTRIRLTSAWSMTDLSAAFLRFLKLPTDRHICLLVDGLDEFEGDYQVIIELLDCARQRPYTKLCVASRPWRVFRDAFQDVPALRLQDLTADDMHHFIYAKLQDNKVIGPLLKEQEQAAKELADAIVSRADGVFLWVSLVMRTIKARFQAIQDILYIQRFVEGLPGSLDDIYRHLLLEANLESLPMMSRIFQLIRAREMVCDFTRDDDVNLMNVWEMALTNESVVNLDTGSPVQQIPANLVDDLCRQTLVDIREHCAGLIEVHPTRLEKQQRRHIRTASHNPLLRHRKIMYLHRTVKDYIKRGDVWENIVSQLPGIDPHLLQVRGVLFLFRFPVETPQKQRNINAWWSRIVLVMTHARLCLTYSQQLMFDYLNAFDDTLNWYWPPRLGSVAVDSWSRSCFGTYEQRGSTRYPDPFLSLATKFGIAAYVDNYLDSFEYEYEEEKPLLSYAVEYLVHRQNSIYPLSDPKIVDILLKNGQDPNLIKQPERDAIIANDEDAQSDGEQSVRLLKRKPPAKLKTPWVLALEAVQQADRRGWIEIYDINPNGTARWARILRAFLENGADPNVVVAATYKDKQETAVELIKRILHTYQAKEIKLVYDLLITKMKP